MTRHRSLLITLGTLQLLAAGFFMVEGGMLAKYAGRESIYAAMEIVETLEDRGELVVPADARAASEQQNAIGHIVRDKIERRESTIELYVWTLAILGVIILVAALIPERRRERIQHGASSEHGPSDDRPNR